MNSHINKALKFVILIFVVLLSGCASTHITSVWIDPENTRIVDDLLIIGVSDSNHKRRIYEDAFVSEFEKQGVSVMPSYEVIARARYPDIEYILDEISNTETSHNAVLVTHIADYEEYSYRHPPSLRAVPYKYFSRRHGSYRTAYRYIHTPSYVSHHTNTVLETNLYDRQTGALLWSAQSESKDPPSIQKLMKDLAKKVNKELVTAGFLAS